MDNKNTTLISQIRHILNEMESLSNQDDKIVCKPHNHIFEMLEMSGIICWEFDSTTNSILRIEFTQEGMNKSMVSSLSNLLEKICLEERKIITNAFFRLIQQETAIESFTYHIEKNDGFDHYKACAKSVLKDGKIKIYGVVTFTFHENNAEREALLAQQKFELLISIANMYLWEYDAIRMEFVGNAALCKKIGVEQRPYTLEELQSVLEFDELNAFLQSMQAKKSKNHSIVHIRNIKSDDTLIFETSYNSIMDCDHNISLVLGSLTDITEQEVLKLKASKDQLTNCYNRGSADLTLASTFEKFKESGEIYTLIFFDVDEFKEVNDRYGHDAGDYVLKNFSSCIMQEVRNTDRLFRWGGDEFLLICGGIPKENMYVYIERLRRIIENYDFVYEKKKLNVTASIGAAYYYKTDTSFQVAMKRADRSVYKAKLAGRNKSCMLLK